MERGLRRNRNVAFGSKRIHETLVSFASSAAALRGTQRGFYLDLIGQLGGFEGVDSYGGGGGWALVVDGPDGTLRKRVESMDPSVRANGAIQANDPTGGVIVFADSSSPRPRLIAFDPAGAVRWNVEVAATMGAAFGVDRMGNALLLFDGGSLFSAGTTAGQWVDHAGTPGAIFDAKVAYGTQRKLFPRVGSGLFYRSTQFDGAAVHNSWIAQFDALAQRASPPPDWLIARPDTKIAMARGGKAYGLLPSQSRGAPACAQTVEVMSASGASCGTATFKIAAPACTTQSIDVGYDGTVLQQLPTEMEAQSSAGPVSCTLRWWPGFLR